MIIKLIQEKVPLGSKVRFSLKNGESLSGILTEIGLNYISLEEAGKRKTVIAEMIGAWEILNETVEDVPLNKENIELEIIKKLSEIEAQFQAKIQNIEIEPEEPDFILDSNEVLNYHREIETAWNRIKNRYEYAKRINELNPVFGRVQQIINDLQSLINKFPNLKAIKRIYAYLSYLAGKTNVAYKVYDEIADYQSLVQDWYNLAAFALKSKNYETACFSLERFFINSSIIQYQNAWFKFIYLVMKFKNYRAIKKIVDIKSTLSLSEEISLLFETGIFLLKNTNGEIEAKNFLNSLLCGNREINLVLELYSNNIFNEQPEESYLKFSEDFERKITSKDKKQVSSRIRGYIYQYLPDRSFGFLYDSEKNKYFFHRSAIIDDELLNDIKNLKLGDRIYVDFEIAEGVKGPVAVQISKPKTIEEIFKSAVNYAEKGDYAYAISLIRRVLIADPNFPQANNLYEKWREYARITGIPKGENPYARAKRAQLIEKDYEKAIKFFNEAIIRNDNTESAIKDLAALLIQLNRPNEAVELIELNKSKIKNQESLDNLLITLYQNAKLYDNALVILQKKLLKVTTVDQKIQILGQIGSCYIKKENYKEAINYYNEILRIQPDNIAAKRNIAICLMKQNQYDEAKKLLLEIIAKSPDSKSLELLEILKQVKDSGFPSIGETLIEITLSDFSGELTDFAKFFLSLCDFQGVAPDKLQERDDGTKDFIGSTDDALYAILRLKEIARQLGAGRPKDRSEYYMSAARIAQKLDDNLDRFYQYLYVSFTSKGDASLAENRHIDTSREFYCEALNVYSAIRTKRELSEHKNEDLELDAKYAFVRFILSLLGHTNIPLSSQIPSIEGALEQVLNNHPNRDKAFELLLYLMYRSRYAAKFILKNLYQKTSLQAMAIDYLQKKGIVLSSDFRRQDFLEVWNSQIAKLADRIRAISNDLRYLKSIDLTTSWLEDAIKSLREIQKKLFFDLDQQRVRQIIRILENCIDLCKQVAFEEKERLCIQIFHQCENMLDEIVKSPTKISIEDIYPMVVHYKNKISEYLDNLYESSVPNLSIQLPIETYIPNNNNIIEAQITLSNMTGRSPAESLEIVIQEDTDLFTVVVDEIKIDESLRGGEQKTIKIPLKLKDSALKALTFSISMYAQYKTRKHEIKQTDIYNFSIRLYSEDDFEEIPNPYAPYAEGGAVTDAKMFYGREELILNILKAITSSDSKSKCIIIFGQKRAGKSSILYHLKNKLEDKGCVVLDIGNIGGILDPYSNVPLLYQIMWSILNQLNYSVFDLYEKGYSRLNIEFPNASDFYNHPSPLVLFKNIMSNFKKVSQKYSDWKNIHLVLMIDEFSYIYGEILSNRLPATFMKNWKAILQENFFSAILAGQDVMPKFKQKFPNEFGTTQDERITYLKKEDAEKLIDEPIRIGGRNGESRYRGKAIQRILELTAGSPFYIQIFCNRLVEYMNRKKANLITEADVEQVKNELIRGVNALSIDKFDNLINSGDTSDDAINDQDTLSVLKTIAKNSRDGHCHRDSINCITNKPIDFILDDLVKRDVLRCEQEHYYSIKVKLFDEWLKSNS